MFDEQMHGLQGKDFALGRLQKSTHVFPSYLKPSSGYAGDDIIISSCLIPESAQALNTSHFIAGSSIIFSQFGLNNRNRCKFIWYDKVRSLIEAWNFFGPLPPES